MNKLSIGRFQHEVWQDDLREFAHANLNFEIEFSELDFSQIQMNDWIQNANPFGSLQLIFLSPQVSDWILEKYPQLPEGLREAGFADCLLLQERKIWPRPIFAEEMKKLAISRAPQLNTHQKAYIAAHGAFLKLAISLAVGLGFKKIVILCADVEVASRELGDMQRILLGAEIVLMPEGDLTLQANDGSLLISDVNESTQKGLLNDLCYFNFLSRQGLVIDLNYSRQSTLLELEAQTIGVKSLNFFEVFWQSLFVIGRYQKWIQLNSQTYFEKIRQMRNPDSV